MTRSVTKAQVITALQTEPLRRGQYAWLTSHEDEWDPELWDKEFCAVCAVGASVAHALGTRKYKEIDVYSSSLCRGAPITDGNPLDLCDEGRWWNALSCKFERQGDCGTEPTPDERAKLVQFVTDHFPDTLDLP